MYVVRAADAPRVRWRNDGGWTREIVRVPATVVDSAGAVGAADSFDWRVSIADVETDGPFSAFDGFDRVLVLLDGAGMDLHFTVTGETTRLRPADRRAKFAGEAPIHATLVDGPTSDFNLMSRREGLMATARYGDFTDSLSVGHAGVTAGVYLVAGSALLPDGTELLAGDTVVGDDGERLELAGKGAVVAFMVWPHTAADQAAAVAATPFGLVVGAKS